MGDNAVQQDWLINYGATQQACFIFNEAELMSDNPRRLHQPSHFSLFRLLSARDMLLMLLTDAAFLSLSLLKASFQKAGIATLLSPRVYHTGVLSHSVTSDSLRPHGP